MSLFDSDISEGDVIFSGWQYMVVVGREGEFVLASPFVTTSEPRHRRDVGVSWTELSEAGLPHPDMRLRGVLCRRRGRAVTRVGVVGEAVLARLRLALDAEMAARAREVPHAPVWSVRDGSGGPVMRRGAVRSMVF
ncbi:hypothetical protein [Acidomonas methanolica]|uniref:hypothetical protein n=1 Tax=Acidomonas methanolica TaxID=437 RepID=UPI00211A2A1D|nr:hypothetical protein [Acidomonas methanolica]MCQ9154086.1 hypothetical protein [Acidomonas methanolica]